MMDVCKCQIVVFLSDNNKIQGNFGGKALFVPKWHKNCYLRIRKLKIKIKEYGKNQRKTFSRQSSG
jgi:hypothetical protein